MSKLDEVIYPLVPNSQYLLSDEAKQVKKNIKDLLTELVRSEFDYEISSEELAESVIRKVEDL